MTDDIQGIIESQTHPIESLRLNSAFIVPIYQRTYEWDKDLTRRFVSDLFDVSSRIAAEPNRIDYIGSIITARTPDPDIADVGDAPPMSVYTLVDGQQRITTLTMISIALRNQLDIVLKKRPLNTDKVAELWIQPHLEDTRKKLLDLTAFRMPGPEVALQPRSIRLMEDSWSYSGAGKFRSPVATLVSQYLSHITSDGGGSTRFRYRPPEHSEAHALSSGPGDFQHIGRRYGDVHQLVKWLREGDRGRDDGIPAAEEFLTEQFKEPGWFSALGLQSSAEQRPAIVNHARNDEEFAAILRLFIVSRFMLSRTVVSWARAKHEDHALEMFDALNTMGTPLTAIACFKPVVVSSFSSSSEFDSSHIGLDYRRIEDVLSKERGEARRNMARDLVSVFELAESGSPVGRKLPDQRRALRNSYSTSVIGGSSERTVRLLRRSAEFIFDEWSQPERTAVQVPGDALSGEAGLALAVLRDSRHTVVQSLLSRFYFAFKDGDLSTEMWLRTIRAVGGFWILWKAANEGRYPDSFYRSLLMGSPDSGETFVGFSRANGAEPNVAVLSQRMQMHLSSIKAASADEWISAAVAAPLYARQRHVAKAILLAASHCRIADPDAPGRLKTALLAEETSWLRWGRWTGPSTATLEHIAPVNPQTQLESVGSEPEPSIESWDSEFYISDRVHQIGNLTLLPIEENSSVSNRPWSEKRVLFKALAQPTAELTKDVLAAEGPGLPQGLRDNLVTRGTYATSPVLSSLAGIDEFTYSKSQERGKEILGAAYGVLRSWVTWPGPA